MLVYQRVYFTLSFPKPIIFGISMLGFFFMPFTWSNIYPTTLQHLEVWSHCRRDLWRDTAFGWKGFKLAPTLEGAGIYVYIVIICEFIFFLVKTDGVVNRIVFLCVPLKKDLPMAQWFPTSEVPSLWSTSAKLIGQRKKLRKVGSVFMIFVLCIIHMGVS